MTEDTTEEIISKYTKLNENEKKPIKLILCGDYGSGKTSLMERHIYGVFKEERQTPISKTKVKLTIKVRNEKETLLICDTNGEEKYKSLQTKHYLKADCAIIVFDVSNPSSFESVDYWITVIKTYEPNIPLLIVGNKIDKRIEIQYEQAFAYCTDHKCELIYCSAKTGKNVNKVFRRIIHTYLNSNDIENIDNNDIDEEDNSVAIVPSHSCCC